jgi:hypothetical protein
LLPEPSGSLRRWSHRLERARAGVHRTEQASAALTHRSLARLKRRCLDLLGLGLLALIELELLWRRALNAVAGPPRPGG